MNSIALDVVFGLVLVALVAASVTAAVVAGRHTRTDWHPTWLRRSAAFAAGAVGTLVLWVGALVVVPV